MYDKINTNPEFIILNEQVVAIVNKFSRKDQCFSDG